MVHYHKLMLLAAAAAAYAQTPAQAPPQQDDIPDDAASLTNECKDILFSTGMTKSYKSGATYTENYDVELKLSASSADLADVISRFKVTPTLKFDSDSDRGFIAKLSYQQVCDLDKDSKVSFIVTCPKGECIQAPPVVDIPVVPEAKGLDPNCARAVSAIMSEFAPESLVAGQYIALTKIWATPEASDAFFKKYPSLTTGDEQGGHYGGKWSPQQLCEVEKSALVQKVETWAKDTGSGTTGGVPVQASLEGATYEEEEVLESAS